MGFKLRPVSVSPEFCAEYSEPECSNTAYIIPEHNNPLGEHCLGSNQLIRLTLLERQAGIDERLIGSSIEPLVA